MRDQRHDFIDDPDRPISISRFVHTLRRYSSVIVLSMLAVMVGYAIVAGAMYSLAPAHRMTTVQFRLDFEGAERGEYPNGIKFAPSEVLATPVVLKVYKQNGLEKYADFTQFSRSLVVMESNLDLERLVRDYQARLSDPKLNSVERDRMQREYESRLSSVKKGQFSLSYVRPARLREIPEPVIRKALHDIIREWTHFVSTEQHVLEYRISVISPDIVADSGAEGKNPIVKVAMLRSKVLRVLTNIENIRQLPAGELARTDDGVSLNDISIRLDDIVRFRLEPLIQRAAAAQIDDRTETIRFLETQLAYDQRRLESFERMAQAAQQTLTLYVAGKTPVDVTSVAATVTPGQSTDETRTQDSPNNGVVPQLSDSFIERLVQLTSNSVDVEYRQRLAEEYRNSSLLVAPLRESVAYDQAMLEFVRRTSGDNAGITLAEVDQQIAATRTEVRNLVQQVSAIYKDISANLNPTTELITMLGVPTSRVYRSVSIKKLALYGILLALLALPLIVLACLIHNRVREEEEQQQRSRITRSDAVETIA